ncbi:MAG: ATP-dependent zinc metalloprotease FtsH [Acidobacteria bacterium]|nr:ATP-dependent zinc metalloprotease FtsH [Acidobacteriota bacterium]
MTSKNPAKPPRRGPFGRPLSPIWFGAAFVAVLLIANLATTLLRRGETLEYYQFKTLLEEGRLADVRITKDAIRGTYQNPDGTQTSFTTVRVEDPNLTEQLQERRVRYSGEVQSEWVAELLSWLFPILLVVALWTFFFRRMGGAEGGIMSFARSRAKVYVDDDVKVSFSDVAGVDEAAQELREIVEFLKNPSKYTAIGGRIPKGVLLVGPPGTGKTLLARAVAGEAKVPFFILSGSEFVEMFVGVGAARVRDLFRQADQKAPCIVFIDELDALGKVRQQSPMGGHEEREQTLNQLLAEMDGFDSKKGVIIMAATNRPEVLDPALLRPGRFDRQVLVDKPDIKGREAILRIHAREVKLAESVDFGHIAIRTAGFSGADLANLVNEAALLAARRDKTAVDRHDFDEAIERVVAGLEKKRAMSPRMRRIIAYHEVGHALVGTLLPGMDPVHKVSIVGRGFGALGYTMHLPTEDRYLRTKAELRNELAVLLGGRTAEIIIFGEVSTGDQNDLLRATDIARAMVTELGMSDAVGPVNHEGRRRSSFLETPFMPERGVYAEDTARVIDAEVKRLITEAEQTAHRLLTTHRTSLDAVAERLLDKEVIEGDELRALLESAAVVPPAGEPAQTADYAEGHVS